MTSSSCDLPFFESVQHFLAKAASEDDTGMCLRLPSHDNGGIRLTHEDVSDLHSRINVGTKVIVLPMDRRADNTVGKRAMNQSMQASSLRTQGSPGVSAIAHRVAMPSRSNDAQTILVILMTGIMGPGAHRDDTIRSRADTTGNVTSAPISTPILFLNGNILGDRSRIRDICAI